MSYGIAPLKLFSRGNEICKFLCMTSCLFILGQIAIQRRYAGKDCCQIASMTFTLFILEGN